MQTSPTALLFQHDISRDSLWTHCGESPTWIQEELSSRRGVQAVVKLPKEQDGRFCTEEKVEARNNARKVCCSAPQEQEEGQSNILIYTKGTSMNQEHSIIYKAIPVEEEPLLSEDDLLALLKARVKQKDLKGGSKLHSNIVKRGLVEKDLFICSSLVNLYAKCGALLRAREVFNGLQVQVTMTWNALIAGYIHQGQAEEALKCFDQMQREGVFPDAITFSCILKACGIEGLADKGQLIHARIVEANLLGENVVVANSLVMMYVKFGLMEKAQEVFDKLPFRDIVSWNSIITGYVYHGQGEEALKCFERMKDEGFSPNVVTFFCLLKACSSLGVALRIEEIRSEIMREGLLKNNAVLGTALIDTYASCGLLEKAEDVLEELPVRSAISWGTLISGYVQHGHCEEALRCFDQMQFEGFMPNAATFTCILKACGFLGASDKGHDIHVQISKEGSLRNNIVVGNALVDMYAKCGLLKRAQEVFNKLPTHDLVSWNTLITGYAQHGHNEEVLKSFEQMQLGGFFPDAVTFVCMLKACGGIGASHQGQNLHAKIVKEGLLEKNIIIANALVDMYAKCGLLEEAQDVFNKLSVRDVVSWSALIAGYARQLSDQEALNCYKQMQHEGFSPNSVTFLCILKACGSIGAAYHCQDLHTEIVRKGVMEKDMVVGCALVDLYASCGMPAEARYVFDKMPLQDVVLWNALMGGYSLLGEYELVSGAFKNMVGEGIQPDLVTYTILLNTCSHVGLLDEGQMYFELMCTHNDFVPSLEHHTCVVDLFGRAGDLENATAVIKEMPFFADTTVWHIILGACHKWGIIKLGRWTLSHVAHLDENDASAYVSMSNIHIFE